MSFVLRFAQIFLRGLGFVGRYAVATSDELDILWSGYRPADRVQGCDADRAHDRRAPSNCPFFPKQAEHLLCATNLRTVLNSWFQQLTARKLAWNGSFPITNGGRHAELV